MSAEKPNLNWESTGAPEKNKGSGLETYKNSPLYRALSGKKLIELLDAEFVSGNIECAEDYFYDSTLSDEAVTEIVSELEKVYTEINEANENSKKELREELGSRILAIREKFDAE